jgi:hypothetical protein
MKTETIKAFEKSPKGKDGKVLRDKDGNKVKGKCLGEDTVETFETVAELIAFLQSDKIAKEAKEKATEDLNRQRRTDCRNAIASDAKPKSDATVFLKGVKSGKIPQAEMDAFMKRFGLK